MIARKKQWPRAVGASLEIVLAIAVGLVVVGTFRGWFNWATVHASDVGRRVDAPASARSDDETSSARLLGNAAGRPAHR